MLLVTLLPLILFVATVSSPICSHFCAFLGLANEDIVQELETVQQEVQGLIRQANEGGDMSNIKSSASGRKPSHNNT